MNKVFINSTVSLLLLILLSYGCGGSSSSSDSAPSKYFAYVGQSGGPTIEVGLIDTGTGDVTAQSTTTVGGGAILAMATHPTLKVVYAAQMGTGNVHQFTADSTTGALTAIAPAIADGVLVDPFSISITPNGKFLYVLDGNSSVTGLIRVYTIDSTTGALTQGATFTGTDLGNTPDGPLSMSFTANSSFAYVGHFSSTATCVFSINATTGALSQVGATCITSSAQIFAVATSVHENELYTCGLITGIDTFHINSGTGALTTGTNVALPGTATAACHTMVRAGNFLVAAANTGQVSSYAMNSDGTLGAPVTITLTGFTNAGNSLDIIGVSSDGKRLILTDTNENIAFSVSVGTDGSLTQSATNFTSNMNNPLSAAVLQF